MLNTRRMEMAQHAYQTVPAYRKLFEETNLSDEVLKDETLWSKLPLLEKDWAVKHSDEMISEEFLADFSMGRLVKAHTSGSTGTYMDVYWEAADYQNSLLPLWMERWKVAKIHPRDKVCFFNTVLENDKKYVITKNSMIISKSNLNIKSIKELYYQIKEGWRGSSTRV